MRYWKSFARYGLAAALALGAAVTLPARDLRHDYWDLHGDYGRVNALRADIARDRVRLNQDIRWAAGPRHHERQPIWLGTGKRFGHNCVTFIRTGRTLIGIVSIGTRGVNGPALG